MLLWATIFHYPGLKEQVQNVSRKLGLLWLVLLLWKQTVSLNEKAAAQNQLNLPAGRGIAQLSWAKADLLDPNGKTASCKRGNVLLALSRIDLCTCRTSNTAFKQLSHGIKLKETLSSVCYAWCDHLENVPSIEFHPNVHHFFRGRQHLPRWWTCPRLGTLTVPSAISMASSRFKPS